MACRSLDPTLGIWSDFVKPFYLPFFLSRLFSFASFFSFRIFFYLASFCIFCNILFYLHQLALARVSLHQLIVESCASPYNNLIALNYSMPAVFSANLFGLFFTFKVSYMIVDDADADMEMAQDPFLEAGIAIPAELPYQDESQRENSARLVVGIGHQRHESVSDSNLPPEVESNVYENIEEVVCTYLTSNYICTN